MEEQTQEVQSNLATTKTQDTTNTETLTGEARKAELAKRIAEEANTETVDTTGETKDSAETQAEVTQGADTDVAQAQDTTDGQGEQESEVDKLKRTLEEKEKFNQRQATELGELRKQMLEVQRAQLPKVDPEALAEKATSDPQAAIQEVQNAERARQQFEQTEAQVYRIQTEQAVRERFQNFDELIPDMVALAKQDGATEAGLRQFQIDPFSENYANLMHYANRAEATRAIAAKEREIEELKSRTQNVTQQIDKAANAKPQMNNTEGKTATGELPPLSEAEMRGMSKEARRERLEYERKKEELY
jgi:hypothetical protein